MASGTVALRPGDLRAALADMLQTLGEKEGYACQGSDGEQRSRRGAETKLGHRFKWRKGTIETAAGRRRRGATEVYMRCSDNKQQ